MSETPQGSPLDRQDWSDVMGQRWLDHLKEFEGMIAPVGAAILKTARLAPGERVVDVGCGAGPTTLDVARSVTPGGYVLGLDVSPVLVDAATRRQSKSARPPGSARIKFQVGDAATAALDEPPFDLLFSRFGLMFFEDPYSAFAHMRGWLKPSGRTAFSCWAPASENPWILEIEAVLRRHVETPEPTPDAPGPFGLADAERTRDILAKAGFVDIAFETWRGDQPVGGPGATPAHAAAFAMSGMHVGQVLGEAPDELRERVRADLQAMFARNHSPAGVLLPSTVWLVTAKAGTPAANPATG
jgi:SAM-dependent methyltransferase